VKLNRLRDKIIKIYVYHQAEGYNLPDFIFTGYDFGFSKTGKRDKD
jgi:hypothetical protein